MDILNKILNQSKKIRATILLPEANLDKRVNSACKFLLKENLCKIVVLGSKKQFDKDFLNPNCTIIDASEFKDLDKFANQLYELRKSKGLTLKESQDLIKTPEYFSVMLLKNGYADGMVAGAKWTTANTLRPALQIIKCKPNKSLVTGVMLMVKKDTNPLIFADISLIENPTSEQLAEIAISSAELYEKLIGKTPKTALLSYSTKGSAQGELVDKVKSAVQIARLKSKFLIDGEMQVDCALDEQTAKAKGMGKSKIAGRANVLVFPDLNAGNIGYKLVARLGGYTAIGPIMLNFNKPVNDLSRGCTIDEIVNTVLITKLLI